MNKIVQSLKFIFLLSISIMLTACAVSMAGRDEFIALDQGSKHSGAKDFTVSMSCPGKIYSMMAFILVPLPPIIPTYWGNKKISRLYITAADVGSPEVEVTRPSGDAVEVVVNAKNKSQNHNDPAKIDYYFHLNKDCGDLDGYLISIKVGENKESFYIRYTEGKVKFEWSYLGA